MTRLKSMLAKGAMIAAVAGSMLAVTATSASAYVACNRFGECWHTQDRYTNYPTGLGVVFHDDTWAMSHRHHWRWRQDRPDDRGYYRNGVWIGF